MRKLLIEKRKTKEISLHGEKDATPFEKKLFNIVSWISFIGAIITGYLYFKDIIPVYWLIIFLVLPIILVIIFIIRHFVFEKTPIHYESYDLNVDKNDITGKDDVVVSNYEHKVLNDDDKGDQ